MSKGKEVKAIVTVEKREPVCYKDDELWQAQAVGLRRSTREEAAADAEAMRLALEKVQR